MVPPESDTQSRGKKLFRLIGRRLLYVLIVFLGCLWTLGCFVVVMTAVCLWGCIQNCAHDRAGGAHDLPLLCNGITYAWNLSLSGWQELWTWVEPSHPPPDEEMAQQHTIEGPLVRRPPQSHSRSS